MDNAVGQSGAGGSAPDNLGQNKVNPMSPGFMGSAGGASPSPPPAPNTPPPAGGHPAGGPPKLPPSSMPSGPSPVPPPPIKEVDIRTMASDQASLKSSGGTSSVPTTVKPFLPPDKKAKKIDSAGRPVKPSGGGKKALLIGLGVVVLLGAAAAAVNWWIWPTFFAGVDEVEDVVAEEVQDIQPIPTPTIPSFIHQSFFDKPADAEIELIIERINLAAIQDALSAAAADAASIGDTLTQFYVTQGDAGIPVTAKEVLGAVLPDVGSSISFEEDFTGFFYNDGKKVWPGYIFALAPDAENEDQLKSILGSDIETSVALDKLFLDDPDVPIPEEVVFKDGLNPAELTGVRFLAYGKEGFIGYGWKGDRLVISTSYPGFKEAASMVGEPPAPVETEEEAAD